MRFDQLSTNGGERGLIGCAGMLDRRDVLAGGAALALGGPALAAPALAAGDAPTLGPDALVAWTALDLASGRRLGHAPDRRMPMCSSFKWLLAAFVLGRVDRGLQRLDRRIGFGPSDLLQASPATTAALAGRPRADMTVAELAEAITAVSDNTAADLLLHSVGGPGALTAWLRAHGDAVTRCDRFEPTNNLVPLGDPRDTTTPTAAITDLHRFLYGDILSPGSRERLMGWMLGCRVGEARLKAGLPIGWRIAHRTGTRDHDPTDGPDGPRGAVVDLGVLIPPAGAPILIATYAAGFTCPLGEVEAWMAGVARRVVNTLRPQPLPLSP